GAGEKDQRKRDFTDYQGVAHAAAAESGVAATAGFERFTQIARERAECRRESEDQRGQYCRDDSGNEHADIQMDVSFIRKSKFGERCYESFQATPGKKAANPGTDQGEKYALDQELPHDRQLSGAEGCSNGKLLFPRSRFREQKVGDVRAGDK